MNQSDFVRLISLYRDAHVSFSYDRKKNDPTHQRNFLFCYLNNKGELEIDGKDIEGHTDEPVNFCPNCRRDLNDED